MISLVPSLTETVFALGAGARLVGRTRYCVHPAQAAAVAVVGGTKDPDPQRVAALRPDLVLANREENRELDVRQIESLAPVWVSDVRGLEDALAVLVELGERLGVRRRAGELASELAARIAGPPPLPARPPRVVYLIWRRPYMTVSRDTYIGAVLAWAGAENPFAASQERYPEVDVEQIRAARPDAVFLASEPYRFVERHREEALGLGLAEVLRLVDGEAFCWWGARSASGLEYAATVVAEAAAACGLSR